MVFIVDSVPDPTGNTNLTGIPSAGSVTDFNPTFNQQTTNLESHDHDVKPKFEESDANNDGDLMAISDPQVSQISISVKFVSYVLMMTVICA